MRSKQLIVWGGQFAGSFLTTRPVTPAGVRFCFSCSLGQAKNKFAKSHPTKCRGCYRKYEKGRKAAGLGCHSKYECRMRMMLHNIFSRANLVGRVFLARGILKRRHKGKRCLAVRLDIKQYLEDKCAPENKPVCDRTGMPLDMLAKCHRPSPNQTLPGTGYHQKGVTQSAPGSDDESDGGFDFHDSCDERSDDEEEESADDKENEEEELEAGANVAGIEIVDWVINVASVDGEQPVLEILLKSMQAFTAAAMLNWHDVNNFLRGFNLPTVFNEGLFYDEKLDYSLTEDEAADLLEVNRLWKKKFASYKLRFKALLGGKFHKGNLKTKLRENFVSLQLWDSKHFENEDGSDNVNPHKFEDLVKKIETQDYLCHTTFGMFKECGQLRPSLDRGENDSPHTMRKTKYVVAWANGPAKLDRKGMKEFVLGQTKVLKLTPFQRRAVELMAV
jgi:hypothetical protein